MVGLGPPAESRILVAIPLGEHLTDLGKHGKRITLLLVDIPRQRKGTPEDERFDRPSRQPAQGLGRHLALHDDRGGNVDHLALVAGQSQGDVVIPPLRIVDHQAASLGSPRRKHLLGDEVSDGSAHDEAFFPRGFFGFGGSILQRCSRPWAMAIDRSFSHTFSTLSGQIV